MTQMNSSMKQKDTQNKLWVPGEGTGRDGLESGISRYKPLCTGRRNNKVPLQTAGNYV